jgi:hypothetical protein
MKSYNMVVGEAERKKECHSVILIATSIAVVFTHSTNYDIVRLTIVLKWKNTPIKSSNQTKDSNGETHIIQTEII